MKNFILSFLFFFFLIFNLSFCFEDSLPYCKGKINGQYYDLTPLQNNTADYFLQKGSSPGLDWNLYLNICRAIVYRGCGSGSSGCQVWNAGSPDGQASMSKSSSGTLYPPRISGVNGYGVTVQFTGGAEGRQMELDMVCDPNAGKGFPTYRGEDPALHYNFEWKSQYACPTVMCSDHVGCDSCAANSKCSWCLSDSTCFATNEKSTCSNYVSNQKYCPPNPCPKFTSCDQCAANKQCGWCLNNNSCILLSSKSSCNNFISNNTYCS